MTAAEAVAGLAIALVMVALARRAVREPPAAQVVAPVADGSASASAALALEALHRDLARLDGPLRLTDPAPDGRARTLAFTSGGRELTYGLTAQAAGPGSRGLARNTAAVRGVYLVDLKFRLVSPTVLETELTASDRDGRTREQRLDIVTLNTSTLNASTKDK